MSESFVSEALPVVKLQSVLQQFFSRHAFEDGFQCVQSCWSAVLHIQPVEHLDDVTVQPEQPGRQKTRANHLPHRFYTHKNKVSHMNRVIWRLHNQLIDRKLVRNFILINE